MTRPMTAVDPDLALLERWNHDAQPVTDGILRGTVIGYSYLGDGNHTVQVLVQAEPRKVAWLLFAHLRPLGRNLRKTP